MLEAAEELAELDEHTLDEVTTAIVARVMGDVSVHDDAVQLLNAVPTAARWIVELVVEVQLEASRAPLRVYPCGLRMPR
jgi:hypothetical protein